MFFGWGIYGVWHVISNRPDSFIGLGSMGGLQTQPHMDYGIYSVGCFHAPEIICWDENWYMTSTKKEELRRQDCRNGILKYRATVEDERRLTCGLYLSKILWDKDYPVFVKP